MSLGCVASAAVIDVVLRPRFGLLGLAFARHRLSAVATPHELPAVGQLVTVVVLIAQQHLHAIPSHAVNDWFVFPRIPVALVFEFANICPVSKEVVDRGTREFRGGGTEDSGFFRKLLYDTVYSLILVGD